MSFRMLRISSFDGDLIFAKGVPCTGIIAMQFMISACHSLAFFAICGT